MHSVRVGEIVVMVAMRFFFFWPGLTSAWMHGSARGLFVAVLFAWSLCLILLASLVWPIWLSGWFLKSLCVATFSFWLAEWVRARLFNREASQAKVGVEESDAFTRAQGEYLRGNWFEAEAILLDVIQSAPSDMAAGLLLVGVLRHTRRGQSAMRRLDQLCLYDAATSWRFEIEREKQLINRVENENLADAEATGTE